MEEEGVEKEQEGDEEEEEEDGAVCCSSLRRRVISMISVQQCVFKLLLASITENKQTQRSSL